jgi:NAD(P)-dependent dehydrogenase (short-subunit alcohol dehydrogenase family)
MGTQKTVLVTGTSTGIGLITAVHLAQTGYRVVAGMRDTAKQGRLREAASKAGVEVSVVPLDVNDGESIRRCVEEIGATQGALYGLVNNAGIGIGGFFEVLSEQEFRSVIETNLFGLAAMTRAFLPQMREAGRGVIVNLSSVVGRIAVAGVSAYGTSKWAVEGLTETLYHELKPYGVRVVLIEPGMFRTEIYESNLNLSERSHDPSSPYYEREQAMLVRIKNRYDRQAGDPSLIAQAISRALAHPSPPLRWPVGRDSAAAILLRKLLPERLFLPLISRAERA